MKIETYTPIDFHSQTDLRDLLGALYGAQDNFDFFLDEYERAFNSCCNSQHITFVPIALFNEGALVAHSALIIDDRLDTREAFFGFFEVVNDPTIFECLWRGLIELAQKHTLQILKGPVNGSIWHQYRCITEDSSVPYFKTEPMTKAYYFDFLSHGNPKHEITYSSGIRESYADILQLLKTQQATILKKLSEGNFKINVVKEISPELLLSIATLSATVFNEKSWGYTLLDPIEFSSLDHTN